MFLTYIHTYIQTYINFIEVPEYLATTFYWLNQTHSKTYFYIAGFFPASAHPFIGLFMVT